MSNAELLTGTSRKAGPRGTEPPASAVRCFQSPIFIIIFFFFFLLRGCFPRSNSPLLGPAQPLSAAGGPAAPTCYRLIRADGSSAEPGSSRGGGRSQVAGRSRELPSVLTGGVRRGGGGGEVGLVLRARGEAPRSPLFVSCLPPPPLPFLLPVRPSWADGSSHYLTQ